jgi:nucleotide-binding universal stress UspA family protein
MQIVVGVEGSKSAANAVEWATGAARVLGAELLLVSVVEPGADAAACERLLLGDWSRPAQTSRVPFRTEVLAGDPRLELLDVSAHTAAALIVVGAGHERWFPTLHLGSTSHYLAQHADRPVAVVPGDMAAFDSAHLVVGVDGSEGSAAACRWAGWLAHATGGDVTAVHAWARAPARVATGLITADEADRACRAWSSALEAARVLAGSLAVEAEPVDALVKAVASVGAGLLVLGTRGGGGYLSLQLGSVALRALQSAHVPIVLVPPGS